MKIDSIILRELHLPLVRPFETSFGVTSNRRILLAEVQSEGLTDWGECPGGERPFFSEEWTDSAWAAIVNELGPMLAAEVPEHGGDCPRVFRQVRGNRMAMATLENAIWDIEAQREGISLSRLIGGVCDVIPCGVSLGIQSSIPELLSIIEKELGAGYQRIKLKCKPGWDVEVFERVRHKWPGITLSCDANSSYRLKDADHLTAFDAFDLLMIEQPLWHDDFYYHSMLQKRLQTPICRDEEPHTPRCAGGHRDGVMQDHQHQTGTRGRLFRGHRGAQCGAGAGNSRVVRRDAGVRRGTVTQHRAVDSGKLHAAGRCVRVGALLARGHR